jgi:hypothetical protein
MECVTPESSHCYLYSTLWSVGVTIKVPIQRVPHDSTTGWGGGGGAGNRDLGLCVLESRAYCLLYRKILLHMVPQASILHNKLQSVHCTVYPFHSHSTSLLISVYSNFLDLIFITS